MYTLSSHAQQPPVQPDMDLVVRSVPEDSMLYIRNAQTVGRITAPQEIVMNSVGYMRYAEQFIYGLEYNSYYAKSIDTRVTNVEGILGYRVLWNKRFLPYALFQFGQATLKDESGGQRYGGNGLSVTLDAGVDVIKIWKIKASLGIRTTNSTFNDPIIPSATFTDLYLMTGIVF
jgi:hypothetical protein